MRKVNVCITRLDWLLVGAPSSPYYIVYDHNNNNNTSKMKLRTYIEVKSAEMGTLTSVLTVTRCIKSKILLGFNT